MFQNFDAPQSPVRGNERLESLRTWMRTHNVDAVIVPHVDEQNNEYLPANKERLAWISGFTGSAGEALITLDEAVLFVDGRYTLQSAEQTDEAHWQIESLVDHPIKKWIASNLDSGTRLAFDPWLHTSNQVKQLKEAAGKPGIEIAALDQNPIDAIWEDRPPSPLEPVRIHDFTYAGKPTSQKMDEIEAALASNNVDLCILTDPASVCWLFNIRGSDVAHTPITLAHAILRSDQEPIVFIDDRKLNIETRAFLTQVAEIQSPSAFIDTVSTLAENSRVMLDTDLAPFALSVLVEEAGGTVVVAKDPVRLPRATKNAVEIEGSRSAHLRDGAAMASFLHWIDEQPPGSIDEITAAQKLEEIRTAMAGDMPLRDVSFDTISGSGPNGAIVHYRVNRESNRTLQDRELYLCDSGAQYDDGTTDITRTVAIGKTGADERRAFTLVLKGHIAIANARFPEGTRGVDLDPLARAALWQNGFDYAHGTGHGVGSYLSVHEGPQGISRRSMQALLPGMILSNEPGYYREGAFGIRIENLVLVHEASDIPDGDQPMLGFETLTLAPIDTRLVDTSLMTEAEIDWLNSYHERVRTELSPQVSKETGLWLARVCKPLGKHR